MTALTALTARLARPIRIGSVASRWRSAPAPTAAERGMPAVVHALTLVKVSLLVRLVALAAGLVGLAGSRLTPTVLVAVVLLSLTSFVALVSPRALAFLVRHPIVVVADALLAFTALTLVGLGSPLALATMSSALVLGALFEWRMAALLGTMLLALYTLARVASADADTSFMTVLGLPVIYACLLSLGMTARYSDTRQLALLAEVAHAREVGAAAEERARLARELHDSVGKSLYGIALLADSVAASVDGDPAAARANARLLSETVTEAAAQARLLMSVTRADRADQPLAASLATACTSWHERTGIACELVEHSDLELDLEARYETLAVVLEALENVVRHAGATRVQVRVVEDEESVVVEVSDDGRGFTARPDGASPQGHFGLTGMRERAERVGARFAIVSVPGQGTTVRMVHPTGRALEEDS